MLISEEKLRYIVSKVKKNKVHPQYFQKKYALYKLAIKNDRFNTILVQFYNLA